jgi:hypothetical protein
MRIVGALLGLLFFATAYAIVHFNTFWPAGVFAIVALVIGGLSLILVWRCPRCGVQLPQRPWATDCSHCGLQLRD